MFTRIAAASLALLLAFALVGCAAEPETPDSSLPPVDNSTSGMRLANGLYDLEDGSRQAVGTLAYIDLEGGFWAITGALGAEPDAVTVVIANGADLESELKPLEGKTVFAVGTKAEGVSTRMAGPEMNVDRIEEISDTPGVAE